MRASESSWSDLHAIPADKAKPKFEKLKKKIEERLDIMDEAFKEKNKFKLD